jgi:demethylmenaquinone methyltransferase/2-methoxy-6-polyprenyl-1,4-benzoquinol methylase
LDETYHGHTIEAKSPEDRIQSISAMSELELLDVPRTKSQARRSYDRMSSFYDWMAGSSEWKLTKAGLEMLDPHSGQHILEIGAGTGRALLYLSQQVGPNGSVTGLDLSRGMLSVAANRLHNQALHNNVRLVQADGANPPFFNQLFDSIFLSFTLELFDTPELPMILKRCQRLLKSDGLLQVVALARPQSPGLAVRIYEFFHRLMPTMVDCRPIPTAALLAQAGFTLVEQKRVSMWGLPVDVMRAHS